MKHRYIAIEGPIGVGKTTLATLLAKNLDTELVLEVVEENPFLLKFYDNISKYAFQTQLFFLLSRYRQLQRLKKMLISGSVVSDYIFAKDRIFAMMNLVEDELELYEQVYAALNAKTVKPDLVIYMRAPVSTLIKRIKQRGRGFERAMTKEYLERLSKSYEDFFSGYAQPLIKIDAEKVNILNSRHLDKILEIVSPLVSP